MVEIRPFTPELTEQVVALILGIENDELGFHMTVADQPDLLEIPSFYQSGRGGFWVALNPENEVVGTIGLIDTGHEFGVVRKMFVKKEWRGSEKATAMGLFSRLENWAVEKGFESVMLGTHTVLKPAIRFYEKLGFRKIPRADLPKGFPVMSVNNIFFKKSLPKAAVRPAVLEDIAAVLEVQSRHLFRNLTDEERLAGFVTTPFTAAQIERVILEEAGLFVAVSNQKVVGYAFGASWGYWSQWPIFVHMIERMPLLRAYRGVVVSAENSFQYGPICLDHGFRGQGVAERLFAAVRDGFSSRFPAGLTFINQVNALSTAFHTRKLGLEIVDEFEFAGKRYFGLAFPTR